MYTIYSFYVLNNIYQIMCVSLNFVVIDVDVLGPTLICNENGLYLIKSCVISLKRWVLSQHT